MKQIILIIASVLFSILFFEKSIGLNLSIFTVITIAVLAFYNPKKFRKKAVIVHSILYLLTAILVFIQHSNLAIIANCFAFFTVIGAFGDHKTSLYIQWLNGIFTAIAGFFYRNFEVDNTAEKVKRKKDIDVLHLVKLIGIPLVFIILFVLLYKNGNPLFNNLVNTISFKFVNIQWLLFSVLGYFLFSNISKPILVEPATTSDHHIGNELIKSETFSEEPLKKETQLGVTLLGMLNLLIVLYMITDVAYLLSTETKLAADLSKQVHNGIYTLIASIVIAIIIILYVFRGNLNFYRNNKRLKHLTYLWICLNVVLITLIAIKNQDYILSFGLTYKRIGVHVYIFLTLIGLITTFLKVMNIKNLAFLFRVNTQIAFVILIALSSINWDRSITKFNIRNVKNFDVDYLIKLSNQNAIMLHNAKQQIAVSQTTYNRIDNKYRSHLKDLENRKWQEYSYETYQYQQQSLNSRSK
ncbi:MAG: DUF4173 domain-containing protein [Psychroserpens sp.]|uniref:DUF4153 domain-containing protein n=1 Tax=Psychroserpens sp. TaxID=2020870 RepID=UPI003C72EC36